VLLFRLMLLVLAGAGVIWAWTKREAILQGVVRLLVKPPEEKPPPPLTDGEVAQLWALEAPRVADALELRTRIHELAGDDEAVRGQVDEVLRHLGRQADVQARLNRTLAERRPEDVEEALARATARLQETTDDAARDAARKALEGLKLQREQLARLDARQGEVAAAEEALVVALRNVHLALVDAASSRAAAKTGTLEETRARLELAGADLLRRTEAEEEVERLLGSGR